MNVFSVILLVLVCLIILRLIFAFFIKQRNNFNREVTSNTLQQKTFNYLKLSENEKISEGKKEIIENERFLEAKRKTFLRGEINGKFRGDINDAYSSLSPDNFYNATIYNATIVQMQVRKEQEGEFLPTENVVLYNFEVENPVDCYYEGDSGKGQHYQLNIQAQKLEDISLSGIIIEGKSCFGKIEAIIYGFIEDTVKHLATGNTEEKDEGYRRYERLEYSSHLGFDYWGDWEFKEYLEGLTGNEQSIILLNRRIRRQEYIDKKGETHWGKPIIVKEKEY